MGCNANPMKVKNMVVDAHYRAAASCMRQVALNVFLAAWSVEPSGQFGGNRSVGLACGLEFRVEA